ncbi:YdbC family protein [Salsuginibacillus kocurii]|uniref:YdbC family protein n=1 Tax=Salsuginibacillus kocurii TaxID=427078 RepID=UPI000368B061|nr:YdbC family protein [Salsuginibacillus kocurii]
MASINYEIIETIGVLSESPKGWRKELNLVSWNERPPKYDIRDWSPDHEKMGKGITLSDEEVEALKALLQEWK